MNRYSQAKGSGAIGLEPAGNHQVRQGPAETVTAHFFFDGALVARFLVAHDELGAEVPAGYGKFS